MNGARINRSNPNGISDFHNRLKNLSKKEIAVGFPKGKVQAYPDGTSVIDVAVANNFGIGIPERNFMDLAKSGIEKSTKPILRKIMRSQNPEEIGILQEAAGQKAEEEIKKAIVELKEPPNTPITIALKGSDNPLIETTHMLKAVTYVVRNKS